MSKVDEKNAEAKAGNTVSKEAKAQYKEEYREEVKQAKATLKALKAERKEKLKEAKAQKAEGNYEAKESNYSAERITWQDFVVPFIYAFMLVTAPLVFPLILGSKLIKKIDDSAFDSIYEEYEPRITAAKKEIVDAKKRYKSKIRFNRDIYNHDSLTYEELRKISRDDHQEDVRQYDKQQNALCFVMIGGILLITGILFILLSFKRVKNKMGGIDVRSLQFFVSLACLGAAIVLLGIGLTRFFIAHSLRKQLRIEIDLVTRQSKDLNPEP